MLSELSYWLASLCDNGSLAATPLISPVSAAFYAYIVVHFRLGAYREKNENKIRWILSVVILVSFLVRSELGKEIKVISIFGSDHQIRWYTKHEYKHIDYTWIIVGKEARRFFGWFNQNHLKYIKLRLIFWSFISLTETWTPECLLTVHEFTLRLWRIYSKISSCSQRKLGNECSETNSG